MLLDALPNGGDERVAAIGRDDDTALGSFQQHRPGRASSVHAVLAEISFPKRSIEAEQAAIAAGRDFERKPQEAVERLDLGYRGERHDDRSRRACDTKRVRVEMEALGCIDVGEDNDRDNEDGARNESRLQPNVRRSARHQLEDTTEDTTHHDEHERSHAKNEPVHRGVKTHGYCDGGAAPDKC